MIINSQEELSLLMSESKKKQHGSQYNFIRAHNSYRNGKMHLAIGPSSGGKSTLTRSLLLDFLLNLEDDEKVYVHLSEETQEEFLIELGSSGISFQKIKQLIITSEQDKNYGTAKQLLSEISLVSSQESVRGVFFDNITTSLCYLDRNAQEQAQVATALKKICNQSNKPLILIGHTGGQSGMATQRLLEMNDIRGGKSIVNLVEFMYILQPIFCGNERHNIVTIAKHRGYSIKNMYFELMYSDKAKLFVCDKVITFEQYKEIFKNRNTL